MRAVRLDKRTPSGYDFGMTLKSKNRIYVILFVLSLIFFALIVSFLVVSLMTDSFTPPENPVRLFPSLPDTFLLSYSFYAAVAAVLMFGLAAPVLSLAVVMGFEKTPSLEVAFFTGFIVGCITESVRILLPALALWQTTSLLLVLVGKAVAAGRYLSLMSLFFATVFSSQDDLLNAERNLLILYVSACILAIMYPIDTTSASSACCVLWGFRELFSVMRIFLFAVTCVCLLEQAYSREGSDGYKKLLGFVLLGAGYILLCNTDCWLALIAAVPLMAAGSAIYLSKVHYYS